MADPENIERFVRIRNYYPPERETINYEPKKFRVPFIRKSKEVFTINRGMLVQMVEHLNRLKSFPHEHDVTEEIEKVKNWIAKESLTA